MGGDISTVENDSAFYTRTARFEQGTFDTFCIPALYADKMNWSFKRQK
jgi:hypothetical protein